MTHLEVKQTHLLQRVFHHLLPESLLPLLHGNERCSGAWRTWIRHVFVLSWKKSFFIRTPAASSSLSGFYKPGMPHTFPRPRRSSGGNSGRSSAQERLVDSCVARKTEFSESRAQRLFSVFMSIVIFYSTVQITLICSLINLTDLCTKFLVIICIACLQFLPWHSTLRCFPEGAINRTGFYQSRRSRM